MANHQLQPIASSSPPFLSLVTLMATGRWVGRPHQGRQPAAALRHVAPATTGLWWSPHGRAAGPLPLEASPSRQASAIDDDRGRTAS